MNYTEKKQVIETLKNHEHIDIYKIIVKFYDEIYEELITVNSINSCVKPIINKIEPVVVKKQIKRKRKNIHVESIFYLFFLDEILSRKENINKPFSFGELQEDYSIWCAINNYPVKYINSIALKRITNTLNLIKLPDNKYKFDDINELLKIYNSIYFYNEYISQDIFNKRLKEINNFYNYN